MESVVVRTPVMVLDRYNNEVADWDAASEATVVCAVCPRSSSEDNGNRSALVSGLTMLLPAGAVAVPSHARVVARGRVWEVDGDDADWVSPWGWRPGREVHLKAVVG